MTHRLLRHSLGASMSALSAAGGMAARTCQGCRRRHPHGPPPRRLRDVAGDGPRRHRVTAVTGRMVYELTGSACEGYTQNMRFVTRWSIRAAPPWSPTCDPPAGRTGTASASASTRASTATRRRPRSPPAMPRAPTQRRRQGGADQAGQEGPVAVLARLFSRAALDRAAVGGEGRQGLVPRRPLRRLGERREGLRHRLLHRHAPGARQQPETAASEERRAARPAGGLAGLHRLLRAGLRQEGCGCRSTS